MGLSNSQYDALMREYQKRQIQNKHLQDARIREVYGRIPALEEYDREISRISVQQARKLLAGDQSALTELRKKLSSLREEKELLLASGGYSPEYLGPVYTCPICKDTGYREGKKCSCFRQAEIALLYGESNMERILTTENFDALRMDFYSKELIVDESRNLSQYDYMKTVVELCRDFAEHYPEAGMNLLFTGRSGTGKSFLSCCIARELLDRAKAVLYLTAGDLFQLISDKRFSHSEVSREEKYQGILECDLLIIDDLGTELTNSFTNSELFYLINARQNAGRGTVISTNLNLNELLETYAERIASRLMSSYRMIPLYGEDIRIRKILESGTGRLI